MEAFCRGVMHTDWLPTGREESGLLTTGGCLAEGRGKLKLNLRFLSLEERVVTLIETVVVEINSLGKRH